MTEIFVLRGCPYCGEEYGPRGEPRHTPKCPLLLDQLKARGIDPKKWIREHSHTEYRKVTHSLGKETGK